MKGKGEEFSAFRFPFSVLRFPFSDFRSQISVLRLNNNIKSKKGMSNILDIKSKAFALRIIRFYKFLTKEKKEFILSSQILRSGTSIGANTRERRNAQSKLDFINKLSIALKEADETQYWLELLVGSEIIDEKVFNSLNEELKEIIALITSSIKTAKNNL